MELDTSSPRVMIVDDNAMAADLLADVLELSGLPRPAVFHHPSPALEAALKGDFDAFVLDIGLPDIDGYDLARRLRASPNSRNALLIALTGYGSDEARQLSMAAGFDHHLVKPLGANAVLSLFKVGALE